MGWIRIIVSNVGTLSHSKERIHIDCQKHQVAWLLCSNEGLRVVRTYSTAMNTKYEGHRMHYKRINVKPRYSRVLHVPSRSQEANKP